MSQYEIMWNKLKESIGELEAKYIKIDMLDKASGVVAVKNMMEFIEEKRNIIEKKYK